MDKLGHYLNNIKEEPFLKIKKSSFPFYLLFLKILNKLIIEITFKESIEVNEKK